MREFRGIHPGADIYVLAAGNTLTYLDPAFFDGKLTIAINQVGRVWGVRATYSVTKHHPVVEGMLAAHPDVPIFVPRHEVANNSQAEARFDDRVHVFEHLNNRVENFNADSDWPTDPDMLVVSWSTLTSGMHLAAYMGARNVILVASDHGTLGDKPYVADYLGDGEEAEARGWVEQIEGQTRQVKAQLIARYGVRVYSLSPFINYGREGIPYRGGNT